MEDLNLQIDTGVKRVTINKDPQRVVEFNPSDTMFVERFYKVLHEIEVKADEYKAMNVSDLEKSKGTDEVEKYIELAKDANRFIREKMDYVFGDGTSQKVFGDFVSYDMVVYQQFLEGIGGIVRQARSEKIGKYLPKNPPVQKPVTGARTTKPRKRK